MHREVDIQLTLAARADELPGVRQMIRAIGRTLRVNEALEGHMLLAVDEACANVIRHAYAEDRGNMFSLYADMGTDEVVVTVEDDGEGLADDHVERTWFDPDATSGRGFQIIRHVMTDVQVSPSHTGGTRVLMRKRLSARDDPGGPSVPTER